ncbi:MAG: hypothetical protein AUJ92_01185 [Armatimonadetes bacterium CG2_30_59_28]|nr:STAS/SEC14 domain-containing protein [Armatimonadota bacterium]OIO98560.1 MAG: hypothetical protein AUJ92_01185 [Armatimonadetes bacterium CG2_30_59_28]PIU60314.1 MAG: STAS/SEC14 domain-containing protein [Armatimonadetes bacterium CG07_land_8_20_14_0_80_59_28]PIY49041.1 MAG: STAS/SEC14 domain-containing protein [Armatimonadetes bacterium CG_4_10_14_3_um_filter_59_10]PJB67130.1 MAG: STAS/SEC14 domain-containing protein [Armatimonadetes bacterium CG_4_9_14_3_um_filter_58_7]
MPLVHVDAEVPIDELLRAVRQLYLAELENFVSQVISLRAERVAPSLPPRESSLHREINRGIPFNLGSRYDELIAKRDDEFLSPEEHEELLLLTKEVEHIQAQRIEYLAELAQLRTTSLRELMQELSIGDAPYAVG